MAPITNTRNPSGDAAKAPAAPTPWMNCLRSMSPPIRHNFAEGNIMERRAPSKGSKKLLLWNLPLGGEKARIPQNPDRFNSKAKGSGLIR